MKNRMLTFLKVTFCIIFLASSLVNLYSQDKNYSVNLNLLKESVQTQFNFLSRKEQLLLIKPKNLSLMLDLRATQKNDYSEIVKTEQTNVPLFIVLDKLLNNTGLYYHLNKNTLVISSELYWLNKEEPFSVDYDITNLYDSPTELIELLKKQTSLFEIAKCKLEFSIPTPKTLTVFANKFAQYQIKRIFEAIRNPITNYTTNSNQLFFIAENKIADIAIDITPTELTADEWLTILTSTLKLPITTDNELAKKFLKENKIKINEKTITTKELAKRISDSINYKLYYRVDGGLFIVESKMERLSPVQSTFLKAYRVKQFTDKVSGQFIAQNIKDTVAKEIWVYPNHQINYYKPLEIILVACPNNLIPEIDIFFSNIKTKYP